MSRSPLRHDVSHPASSDCVLPVQFWLPAVRVDDMGPPRWRGPHGRPVPRHAAGPTDSSLLEMKGTSAGGSASICDCRGDGSPRVKKESWLLLDTLITGSTAAVRSDQAGVRRCTGRAT